MNEQEPRTRGVLHAATATRPNGPASISVFPLRQISCLPSPWACSSQRSNTYNLSFHQCFCTPPYHRPIAFSTCRSSHYATVLGAFRLPHCCHYSHCPSPPQMWVCFFRRCNVLTICKKTSCMHIRQSLQPTKEDPKEGLRLL